MDLLKLKILVCAFLLAMADPYKGVGQDFSMGAGKDDELFLYEVKAIDEFIERFNDDKQALIRKELEQRDKQVAISRGQLLLSLFNLKNNWNKDSVSVKKFCRQVLDPSHPTFLFFEDTNWYAEAKCVFLYGSKRIEIPVILHIKKENNNGLKWMIAGIGDNVFLNDTATFSLQDNRKDKNFRFIPPSGYATNFTELYNIFSGPVYASYFFEPQLLATARASHFIHLIQDGTIKFQCVKSVKYHFYEVDNWIFTVEHFSRNDMNSGWLINNLKTANKTEKATYKKQLLHI